MISEKLIGTSAAGSIAAGGVLFLAPEHTPKDWTFVHQNSTDFHIAGAALLVVGGALSLFLAGKRMNQKGWKPVNDQGVQIVPPTPGGVEAGRKDDRRRARRRHPKRR